jgi:hypothetical protein
VQPAFAILETDLASTVEKSMEKRGQISAPQKPNAATRADVERVKSRINALGVDFHDAVKQADISYPTGYRILKGDASVGSLRKLEDWVVKEERRRKLPAQPTAEEQDARLAEWLEIGRELARLDPGLFDNALDGLRDMLGSVKLREQAISKIFRATPDAQR